MRDDVPGNVATEHFAEQATGEGRRAVRSFELFMPFVDHRFEQATATAVCHAVFGLHEFEEALSDCV